MGKKAWAKCKFGVGSLVVKGEVCEYNNGTNGVCCWGGCGCEEEVMYDVLWMWLLKYWGYRGCAVFGRWKGDCVVVRNLFVGLLGV